MARSYRQLYEKHWWWRSREAAILDVLRNIPPDGGFGSILDVGCGDGLFFDQLSQFGEVEGIEFSADLLDPTGPHRKRIRVAPFDAQFQPGKRDGLVTMLDVLEHLADPVAALQHALTLLAPAGKIVITVPAFNLIWTTHDDLNHHRTRYTKRSFQHISDQAGMQVEVMRYWYQWPFAVKMLVRAVEKITRAKPSNPRIPPAWLNRALYFCLPRGAKAVHAASRAVRKHVIGGGQQLASPMMAAHAGTVGRSRLRDRNAHRSARTVRPGGTDDHDGIGPRCGTRLRRAAAAATPTPTTRRQGRDTTEYEYEQHGSAPP
jgi:SAM-dependent methyltransferase